MPDEQAGACPACHGRMYPKLLRCADCGLEVSTRYASNEFAALTDEQLHLLRIFVLCEGRIRDMEAALGVSYPTVKARLATLRGQLGLAAGAADADKIASTPGDATKGTSGARPEQAKSAAARTPSTAAEILDRLAQGALSYPEAMAQIRALRSR